MISKLIRMAALGLTLGLATAAIAAPFDGASPQRHNLSEDAQRLAAESTIRYSADPEQIAQYLRGRGLAVEASTDRDGDPVLSTRSQGAIWHVYFYGCEGGQNCNSVTFSSAYNATDKVKLEQLNAFTLGKRYANAVQRADGSFELRMDVLLAGGVTKQLWDHTYNLWETQLGAFLRHIDY